MATGTIAVLGASGNIGKEIVKELSERGYSVRAISRNVVDYHLKNVTAVSLDVNDTVALSETIKGVDIVVSALHHDVPAAKILDALKKAGVKRFIAVGGAGTLLVSEGGPRLIDTPQFPEAYKSFALAGAAFLDELRNENEVAWTFFAPPAEIGPGARKGTYRPGTTILLVDDQGKSAISYADYAIALVDELESGKQQKQVTAAY